VEIPPEEKGKQANGLSAGIWVGIGVIGCLATSFIASRCLAWKGTNSGSRAAVLDQKNVTLQPPKQVANPGHNATTSSYVQQPTVAGDI